MLVLTSLLIIKQGMYNVVRLSVIIIPSKTCNGLHVFSLLGGSVFAYALSTVLWQVFAIKLPIPV